MQVYCKCRKSGFIHSPGGHFSNLVARFAEVNCPKSQISNFWGHAPDTAEYIFQKNWIKDRSANTYAIFLRMNSHTTFGVYVIFLRQQ